MVVIPERQDFKNVSPEAFNSFVKRVESDKLCEKVSHVSPSDKSHFDRYGFASNGKRVSVVYDVKARMLSLTAFDDVMPKLLTAPSATTNPQLPRVRTKPMSQKRKRRNNLRKSRYQSPINSNLRIT